MSARRPFIRYNVESAGSFPLRSPSCRGLPSLPDFLASPLSLPSGLLRLRAVAILAVLVGFASPAVAAVPDKANPDPKSLAVPAEELSKARELVQKLGSEAFADREAAERDLAAMGRLA